MRRFLLCFCWTKGKRLGSRAVRMCRVLGGRLTGCCCLLVLLLLLLLCNSCSIIFYHPYRLPFLRIKGCWNIKKKQSLNKDLEFEVAQCSSCNAYNVKLSCNLLNSCIELSPVHSRNNIPNCWQAIAHKSYESTRIWIYTFMLHVCSCAVAINSKESLALQFQTWIRIAYKLGKLCSVGRAVQCTMHVWKWKFCSWNVYSVKFCRCRCIARTWMIYIHTISLRKPNQNASHCILCSSSGPIGVGQ